MTNVIKLAFFGTGAVLGLTIANPINAATISETDIFELSPTDIFEESISASDSFNASASDGNIDFAGTSGTTFPPAQLNKK